MKNRKKTSAAGVVSERISCLVIDVGNTSTSIGHWDGSSVTRIAPVRGGLREVEKVASALDAAGAAMAHAAILASVVPAENERWKWLLKRLYNLELEVLTAETPLPIGIDYPNPGQIGMDRLCDAVGAVARHGAPVAVADFGTALTFDVVNQAGAYIGGLIAPGLPLMTGYLHEKTAQLPEVDLRSEAPGWGDSTEHAMQLGAKLGHKGMVREILSFIRKKTGRKTVFCATGGYAAWALEGLADCSIEPDLTLYGLALIWQYNHPRKKC